MVAALPLSVRKAGAYRHGLFSIVREVQPREVPTVMLAGKAKPFRTDDGRAVL